MAILPSVELAVQPIGKSGRSDMQVRLPTVAGRHDSCQSRRGWSMAYMFRVLQLPGSNSDYGSYEHSADDRIITLL
jgi:hypothetical protein